MDIERIKDWLQMTAALSVVGLIFYVGIKLYQEDSKISDESRAASHVKSLSGKLLDQGLSFSDRHYLAERLISNGYYQMFFPELKAYYQEPSWKGRSCLKGFPEDSVLENLIARCDSVLLANSCQ